MNEVDFLADEISLRYGNVKRARGCFLYTEKGVRLTDMYQEAGRAILGWGGGSAFTMFKNALDRGATGSYNTDFTPRITKAVNDLLASNRKVYAFTEKQQALKFGLMVSKDSTSFWKPWAGVDWRNISSVIIEPPLPWTASYCFLAVLDTPENEVILSQFESSAEINLSSARIPAPFAAAITRSFYNMIQALQERKETDWFIYDTVVTKYWTRKGPYLYPKVSKENYGKFILHCLDNEIAISPVYEIPSIVPFGADKGVFTKLKNNPFVESSSSSESSEEKTKA